MTRSLALQAPGKGLPWFERLAIKYVALPKYFRAANWDTRLGLFMRHGENIAALAEQHVGELGKPVLIRRLAGLEDSSRAWSLGMVQEHLITVGSEMAMLIVELSHGRVPDKQVSIADYKPSLGVTPERFREFLTRFARRMSDDVGERASPTKFPHPWFGPLTAAQWLGVAALHQRLHRQQAELIAGAI